jgi:hypothetical protein
MAMRSGLFIILKRFAEERIVHLPKAAARKRLPSGAQFFTDVSNNNRGQR